MSDTNRAIHELLGQCWHEWPKRPGLIVCVKCSAGYYYGQNPDYEGDISAAMEAVEQLRREKKWGFDLWTEGEEWCAMVDATVRDESLSKAICAAILAAASGEELVGG